MTASVKNVIKILNEIAPPSLAEEWDNVGLMAGHLGMPVRVVLCALDFSADVLAQAEELHANLIVTHHPAIFQSIRRLTDEDWRTALLLEAARHDIAVEHGIQLASQLRSGLMAPKAAIRGKVPLRNGVPCRD